MRLIMATKGYQVIHVYKGYFTLDDEFAIKQYLKEKYCLFKEEWFAVSCFNT